MKKIVTFLVLFVISIYSFSQINHVVNTVLNSFSPSNLTVAVGDTVTWINTGGMHNVNGNQSTFANNPSSFGNSLGSGWTYSYVFTISGTYDYQCDPHAGMGMVGSILVQNTLDTALVLKGVIDFDLPSGGVSGKAIHLFASKNISNLSIYGIGVANNGGGSDGEEFTFPAANIAYGTHILLALDTAAMAAYFDSCFLLFDTVLVANSMISHNGDDAIELYENGSVIEVFGDPNVDGTGEPWEYKDSWAFKDVNGSVSFSGHDWIVGPVNCTDGSVTTLTSSCPYPFCFSAPPPPPPPPPINTSNITFQVDMSQVVDNFNTPELNGIFNGWCGNCNPMTDSNGDEIWQVSLDLNQGDTIEYKFSADNWAIQETNDPNDFCTNGDPTYTNRVLVVPQNDTILLDVCWGSCTICGLPPSNIEDQYLFSNVRIYPNPANGKLNIKFRKNIDEIIIQDLFGRYVSKINIDSNSYSLDVSGFSTNVYILSYVMGGILHKEKFVVLH